MTEYLHNQPPQSPLCDMCGNHYNYFILIGDMTFCEKDHRLIVSLIRKLVVDKTHTVKEIKTKPTTLARLRRND